jgi:hypothetical protein
MRPREPRKSPCDSVSDHGKVLVSPEFLKAIESVLEATEDVAQHCGFSSTYDRVWDNGSPFRMELLSGLTHQSAFNELKVLRQCIEADISKHLLVDAKPQKARELKDLNSEKWTEIFTQFSSVECDVRHAIECYVLEQDTACVFHLMRVAEVGLRALARSMRVSLGRKKSLDWSDWEPILRAMTSTTEQIAQRKKGRARAEQLEFYRGALGEFYGFKDAYRNDVMHGRQNYDEHQAASMLVRVHELMKRLVSRRKPVAA